MRSSSISVSLLTRVKLALVQVLLGFGLVYASSRALAWSQTAATTKVIKLTDVALVGGHEHPLLVDLFETNYSDYLKTSKEDSAHHPLWRSARIPTLADAQRHCASKSMRVPTTDEWLMIASASGQNTRYTFANDSLDVRRTEDTLRRSTPHIQAGETAHPRSSYDLGLDAAGTIGMTGNLREWTIGPRGDGIPCGGSYRVARARAAEDLQLGRLCDLRFASDLETPLAMTTVRCVRSIEPTEVYEITFTRGVSPEQRKLLVYPADIESALITSPKGVKNL